MSDSYFEFPTKLLPQACLREDMHVAVVGGTRGIGLKIVHRLREVLTPQSIITLTARSKSKGLAAKNAVESAIPQGAQVEVKELDITEPDSIKAFTQSLERLDVVICNAGFAYKMADPTPFPEQAEVTNRVNYTGTKNVVLSLLPLVEKSKCDGAGRVVLVSSTAGQLQGARKVSDGIKERFLKDELTIEELDKIVEEFVDAAKEDKHREAGFSGSAYATSKTAVTQLARIVARDNPAIKAYACCPGLCRTDMAGGQWKTFASVFFWALTWIAGHSAYEGADTPTWLAVSASPPTSGKFFRSRTELPY